MTTILVFSLVLSTAMLIASSPTYYRTTDGEENYENSLPKDTVQFSDEEISEIVVEDAGSKEKLLTTKKYHSDSIPKETVEFSQEKESLNLRIHDDWYSEFKYNEGKTNSNFPGFEDFLDKKWAETGENTDDDNEKRTKSNDTAGEKDDKLVNGDENNNETDKKWDEDDENNSETHDKSTKNDRHESKTDETWDNDKKNSNKTTTENTKPTASYEVHENVDDIPNNSTPAGPIITNYTKTPQLNTVTPNQSTTRKNNEITTTENTDAQINTKKNRITILHINAENDDQDAPKKDVLKDIKDFFNGLSKNFVNGILKIFNKNCTDDKEKQKRSADSQEIGGNNGRGKSGWQANSGNVDNTEFFVREKHISLT